jgi:hypothetical protein
MSVKSTRMRQKSQKGLINALHIRRNETTCTSYFQHGTTRFPLLRSIKRTSIWVLAPISSWLHRNMKLFASWYDQNGVLLSWLSWVSVALLVACCRCSVSRRDQSWREICYVKMQYVPTRSPDSNPGSYKNRNEMYSNVVSTEFTRFFHETHLPQPLEYGEEHYYESFS